MKDTSYYFSHDYNARNDRKLMKLRFKMKMQGIGIYWCLVEMLYEEGGKISFSDIPTISEELRIKEGLIDQVLTSFDLFENDGNFFWSNSVKRRLDKRLEKSEKAKESASHRWNNANGMRTHNEGNAIKERKGKKIKEKKMSIAGETSPTHTQEEVLGFKEVQKWIIDKAPRVSDMKEPLTIDQYLKLKERFPKDLIAKLILKMHNWGDLKKRQSAYLTFLSFAEKDEQYHAA
jgi:hypothetical protein